MKINSYLSFQTTRLTSGCAALAFLMLAAGATYAKPTTISKVRESKPLISLAVNGSSQQAGPLQKSGSFKTRSRRLLLPKKVSLKALKAIAEKCGCPMPDEAEGGWFRCFKGCLADAGVSYVSVIICGASCAAAWTGGGAILCAVCLGVSVTVVEVCALGCLAYPDGFGTVGDYAPILTRNNPRRGQTGKT